MPFRIRQIVRSGVSWKRLAGGSVMLGTSGFAAIGFVRIANDLLKRRNCLRCLSAMPDDQRDVIEFLGKPSSYGAAVERVEIIETHASIVFLAGDRAYKLKRAVKYSYLDFSTAERRR